jgi:AraC family transcriptional regulator of adaptative response/methylated-DNA-[protein]-cysteine methyltransferase
VLVGATTKGICSILLGIDEPTLRADLSARFPKATLMAGDHDFSALLAEIVGFIEAPKRGLNLPLDVQGTAFQQRVWQALRAIPLGQTSSYAEIAQSLGAPKSARAVASACASNPLALAIPCHRVVRGDGNLSGYRWGIERKREILIREGVPVHKLKG